MTSTWRGSGQCGRMWTEGRVGVRCMWTSTQSIKKNYDLHVKIELFYEKTKVKRSSEIPLARYPKSEKFPRKGVIFRTACGRSQGGGGQAYVDRGRGRSKTRFLCGRHKWMAPYLTSELSLVSRLLEVWTVSSWLMFGLTNLQTTTHPDQPFNNNK